MTWQPADFERCWCTGVTRAEVDAAIARGCRTVDQLRRELGVCGGCGTCRPEVQALLDRLPRRPAG
jgi:NAD(P)H-nitrite reductase large subunit